jgi:alcohol dehydrogenase class IV
LKKVEGLYRRLGLSAKLPDDVDPANFPDWADRTIENPLYATTIRQPPKEERIELYKKAKAGCSYSYS